MLLNVRDVTNYNVSSFHRIIEKGIRSEGSSKSPRTEKPWPKGSEKRTTLVKRAWANEIVRKRPR